MAWGPALSCFRGCGRVLYLLSQESSGLIMAAVVSACFFYLPATARTFTSLEVVGASTSGSSPRTLFFWQFTPYSFSWPWRKNQVWGGALSSLPCGSSPPGPAGDPFVFAVRICALCFSGCREHPTRPLLWEREAKCRRRKRQRVFVVFAVDLRPLFVGRQEISHTSLPLGKEG